MLVSRNNIGEMTALVLLFSFRSRSLCYVSAKHVSLPSEIGLAIRF